MPLPIYRLRRWLLVIAVLFIAMIAATYFYARMRARNVLKELPNKLGIEIKQTAKGYQFSKSDGKRTLFTIEASDLKQFKLDGSAELHNVSIILYGRDSSRFDQVYGDDFSYDKKSGNVTAHGEVQIDLQANSNGPAGADQAAPKELKNPIHLKTRDLVFNQGTGDAATDERVDFSTSQATGWALGMQYAAKTNTLTLTSQVHMTMNGPDASKLVATHGVITRDPRLVVLEHPRLERAGGITQADEATFFLGPDNEVQRVEATGNVTTETVSGDKDQMRARADEGEMLLTGKQNLLRTATLTGNVHVERIGAQPMQGDAGRAVLDFLGRNELQKVHASEGVRLTQHAAKTNIANTNSPPQDFDITAPIIDFFVAGGNRLDRAETSGAARITITPAQSASAAGVPNLQRTIVTAGRFDAKFSPTPEGSSRLTSIHGAPDAKIVNIAPGLPDRVSTSRTLDVAFFRQGEVQSGISSIVQQGNVAYTDNQIASKRTQAWADQARYTPADGMLLLTGSPRVADGAMLTTAHTIRMNRATDDAFAEGDVKSTYSELKEQPNGALLASSSPIHVTSSTMTAHNSPATAFYEGNARLWQDANVVEAPSIQFDRDRRSLLAQGTATQPVSTVLVQAKLDQPGEKPKAHTDKNSSAKAPPKQVQSEKQHRNGAQPEEKLSDTTPIAISAARLTYADADRKAHYEGDVVAKGASFTESSSTLDAYLLPRSGTSSNQPLTSGAQLDRLVAQGSVLIVQPTRQAKGQTLVYTASDDKFVLTGGPPSIFDAERGKITGVSLTFFRADDRVLVEGEASTPVVTQTRVAR